MTAGAVVDCADRLLPPVRRDLTIAKLTHELFGVITFIRSQPDPLKNLLDHLQRRAALGPAIGLSQTSVHSQTVTILPQKVTLDSTAWPCPAALAYSRT